tara:strand:- start:160 stop:294 length:135 start_codon:yes stop_codon:yes gene_type:complete
MLIFFESFIEPFPKDFFRQIDKMALINSEGALSTLTTQNKKRTH